MEPIQIKMARAAVGWGVRELAAECGLTANTIVRIENGADAKASTLALIRKAFDPFVEFVEAIEGVRGPGVVLKWDYEARRRVLIEEKNRSRTDDKAALAKFVDQSGLWNEMSEAGRHALTTHFGGGGGVLSPADAALLIIDRTIQAPKAEGSVMSMKNPPHPGRLIKDEIDALGVSVAKAAEGLGVTRQQLYRVINGECAISPEMAVRLEKGIGSSAAAWLRMQMNYDLAQIQKHASALAVKRLVPKEVA